jgi:hypothetical protein
MGKKIDHASVKQQAWFLSGLVHPQACKFLLFTPKRQFTVTTAAARAGATRPN